MGESDVGQPSTLTTRRYAPLSDVRTATDARSGLGAKGSTVSRSGTATVHSARAGPSARAQMRGGDEGPPGARSISLP